MKNFMVIGYPKTGNTWLRVMLSRYASEKMPFMRKTFSHGMPEYNKKSYDEQHYQRPEELECENIVFITRNPADTLASLYYDVVYRVKLFSGTIDEMLYNPIYGIEKFIRFHEIWAEEIDKARDHFHLIRYEDLLECGLPIFRLMMEWIEEQKPIEEDLEIAWKTASIESMKNAERTSKYSKWGRTLGMNEKYKNENARKVRKGKTGGYRKEFTKQELKDIAERANSMSLFFGYMDFYLDDILFVR